MDEETFYEESKKYLREILGEADLELASDTELLDSGLLDSLSVLEFFFFIEEVRGAPIDPEEAGPESVSTLRNAYKLVQPA
ncbi:phosphopantetheine-binding protein [Streptomyces sp. NPDC086554]|uniref:phosphopantetheine-binding protein n=1 Tax=Streptomyces sp. NPDC086554 TaxID=3154864 RepID=UPI00343A7850